MQEGARGMHGLCSRGAAGPAALPNAGEKVNLVEVGMSKTKTLEVMARQISFYRHKDEDFISLTDIARHKQTEHTDDLIRNWLRNRNTLEFLGVWEHLYNPDFKPVEFDGFKKQAGLNSFTLTPKQWRDGNPRAKGNIRDEANAAQLVCLSNLENLNALFITEGMPQAKRLKRLNQIAIQQMRLLTEDSNIKRLDAGDK